MKLAVPLMGDDKICAQTAKTVTKTPSATSTNGRGAMCRREWRRRPQPNTARLPRFELLAKEPSRENGPHGVSTKVCGDAWSVSSP